MPLPNWKAKFGRAKSPDSNHDDGASTPPQSSGSQTPVSTTSLLGKVKSKFTRGKGKDKSVRTKQPTGSKRPGKGEDSDSDRTAPTSCGATTPTTTPATSDVPTDDESTSEKRRRGRKARRNRKTARDFENTDKSGIYHIMVRVIEGRDLPGINLRVRAVLDGLTEATRVSSQAEPHWRQNLCFSVNRSVEQLADTVLTLKLHSERRILKDSLQGEWQTFLGSVLQQPDRCVMSKWIALRRPRAADDLEDSENAGFLKISLAIYGNHETPPPLNDVDSDEVFAGAQLQQFTLRFRIFRMHALSEEIFYPFGYKSKKKAHYAIRVNCGDQSIECEARVIEEADTISVIPFDQEVTVPIMWPTVINQISFLLIVSKGKKARRVIARSSIKLSSIYDAGENGFLPTYGPSFLNFYGPEEIPKVLFKREKTVPKDFDEYKYYGRLLLSIDCFDVSSEESTVGRISHDSHKFATEFETNFKYALCATLFHCSNIDPTYSRAAVTFGVSLGNNGSARDGSGLVERASTLPTMPFPDNVKYFTLPWGNYKPVVYLDCMFDNCAFRVERLNAFYRVTKVLDHFIDDTRVAGDQSPEEVCSIAVEAIEQSRLMLATLVRHHKIDQLLTTLDYNRFESRKHIIDEILRDLESIKYEKMSLSEALDEARRALKRTRDRVVRMSEDDSASLPDIFIKMYADQQLVGLARIPCCRVFYSSRDEMAGDLCGAIHAFPIELIASNKATAASENIAAVLHAKLWMGNRSKVGAWKRSLQPADLKMFLEVFQFQKRVANVTDFKDAGLKDAHFADDRSKYARAPPTGYQYRGPWEIVNTTDMWIKSAGRNTAIDKVFELQERKDGMPDGPWIQRAYTTFYGETLTSDLAKLAIDKGWDPVGDWVVDLHTFGDKDGWAYSPNDRFWDNKELIENRERAAHLYRRRTLQRMRKKRQSRQDNTDLLPFLSERPEDKWEYGKNVRRAFHLPDGEGGKKDGNTRRRRAIMELAKDTDVSCKEDTVDIPRFYEVHATISKWQMRAYILWAKELLPSTNTRFLVRATFMHHCRETAIVTKNLNPIWNETLMFEDLMIPGAQFAITEYPPSVILEVKAEKKDDSEEFLGRFSAKPKVVASAHDQRGSIAWHTLNFRNGKTRGALLCRFELFHDDESTMAIPRAPAFKSARSKRFEVPKDMRPEFEQYTVQVLVWGVRNLAKYQLLSVRRPYVQVVVGDFDGEVDPLQDIRKNPNFRNSYLTFKSVKMPSHLQYAPPLLMNLYDTRAFQRKPLIGTCSISNIQKYIRAVSKKGGSIRHNYNSFDEFVEIQDQLNIAHHPLIDYHDVEDEDERPMTEIRIDWWSKYYASSNQIERAPGFLESGFERLKVYDCELEAVPDFRGFEDFLDTFKFRKSAKGEFDDAEEKEVTGELKGKLFITKHIDGKACELPDPPGVEFTGPVECILRVYVVSATGLISPGHKGVCDPYVMVRIGKQKVKLRKSYRADTTEPDFGEMVELKVTIPIEKDLTISVMDKKRIVADDEIGSTRIDLENRLLSKYRGTVGLTREFATRGELGWRDQIAPLKILQRYCKKMLLPPPDAIMSSDGKEVLGLSMLDMRFFIKDLPAPKKPEMCGPEIQRVALYILHKIGLVPEHVETRTLYNRAHGAAAVGNVRCFVDIFPISLGIVPPPIDISVRAPEPYQLRIALFHVTNAIMKKRSFGKPTGDFYFKIFVNGQRKPQKSDIHYRVTDGFGSFNWRFVLDFDYNPWERKVYYYEKKRLFRKSRQELVDPLVILQLWDNNKFKKDGFVGEYMINLLDIEFGKMSEGEVSRVEYARDPKECCRCCVWCCIGCKFLCKGCLMCCCARCSKRKKPTPMPLPRAPRYIAPTARDDKETAASLFDTYASYGTWPMLSKALTKEQKVGGGRAPRGGEGGRKRAGRDYDRVEPSERQKLLDDVGRRKKDDDADIDYVVGTVEMEMQLLTRAEAEADPVGRKRGKPNQNPYLEKPERSRWDSFWFTSRIKPAITFWWRKAGIQCVMITMVIILMVLLVLALVYKAADVPWKIIGL